MTVIASLDSERHSIDVFTVELVLEDPQPWDRPEPVVVISAGGGGVILGVGDALDLARAISAAALALPAAEEAEES